MATVMLGEQVYGEVEGNVHWQRECVSGPTYAERVAGFIGGA
jgi:hypothetical protein